MTGRAFRWHLTYISDKLVQTMNRLVKSRWHISNRQDTSNRCMDLRIHNVRNHCHHVFVTYRMDNEVHYIAYSEFRKARLAMVRANKQK